MRADRETQVFGTEHLGLLCILDAAGEPVRGDKLHISIRNSADDLEKWKFIKSLALPFIDAYVHEVEGLVEPEEVEPFYGLTSQGREYVHIITEYANRLHQETR